MEKELQKIKNHQDQAFERIAKLLGALGAPVRIKLVHFLSQAPLTVEVLADKVDQSVANTSMHLRKMLTEGILQVETLGQKRLYSLHSALFDFWEDCQDYVQKIDPELILMGHDESINWVKDLKEGLKLLKKREAILLDIRPSDEVREDWSELQGSYLHIPFVELKKHLNTIPKKKKVVVLCRGRFCGLSLYAVRYLRELKFDAYRLSESWFKLSKDMKLERSL
jgi:DNA-binding transcriptional ArsR family regulator